MEIPSPNSLESSSITEFIQDSCVVCANKCFIQKTNNSQQVSSDDLLSLLDTPIDGTKTHLSLSLCSPCLRTVFRLEGIYESLQHLQNNFKELQEQIASKILSCRTDEFNSEAAYNVKDSIYKRWGPVLNQHHRQQQQRNTLEETNNSTITNIESLIGLASKIPKGLIISPASPTADVYQQEIDESTNEDNHEVHDSDNDDNSEQHQHQGIQFHLDLKDFEDTNIKIGSLGTNTTDYVEIDESEEEEQEMDEEDLINAEDLIPSIEITSFPNDSDYLPVNGVSWNDDSNNDTNFGEQSSSTDNFFSTSPPSFSHNSRNNLNVKQESTVTLRRYGASSSSTHDSNTFANKPLSTTINRVQDVLTVPVGLPALSPNGQPQLRKKKDLKAIMKKKKLSKKQKSTNPKSNPIFNCTVCPQSFRSREQFKEHLDRHKGEAPTCPICKKVFPRKHNLAIHIRTHTGEKPYECPVCQRMYSDRSNFNAHVRKHISKPFGCMICGKMFQTDSAAHVHATAVHPDHAIEKIISKVTFKKNKTS